jgi:hypothetical protein
MLPAAATFVNARPELAGDRTGHDARESGTMRGFAVGATGTASSWSDQDMSTETKREAMKVGTVIKTPAMMT